MAKAHEKSKNTRCTLTRFLVAQHTIGNMFTMTTPETKLHVLDDTFFER